MTIQKAPGSTVLRMVANGMDILNIEVETDWSPEDIKTLALEEGYGINAANGRFQKIAKAKPASGIVRASQTDTGATDEGPPSREQTQSAVAPVSPSAEEVAPDAPPSSPATSSVTVTDPNGLIAAGLLHADDTIQDLARAADHTITALATALVEYEQRADALAEVRRLEEELAAARVRAGLGTDVIAERRAPILTAPQLAGTAKKRPPVGVDYLLLDRWCQETGRPWRKTLGRPSNALIAEFRAATEDGAA